MNQVDVSAWADDAAECQLDPNNYDALMMVLYAGEIVSGDIVAV